jgi:hypothetical protein
MLAAEDVEQRDPATFRPAKATAIAMKKKQEDFQCC